MFNTITNIKKLEEIVNGFISGIPESHPDIIFDTPDWDSYLTTNIRNLDVTEILTDKELVIIAATGVFKYVMAQPIINDFNICCGINFIATYWDEDDEEFYDSRIFMHEFSDDQMKAIYSAIATLKEKF